MHADPENLIHVRQLSGDFDIELPGAFIYRVSCRADIPDRLLISGQWQTEEDVFAIEYDLTTREQVLLESDGLPAYKCTFLGDQVLYAQRIGEHFENRRINASTVLARRPVNTIVRRQPGQVQTIVTQPTGDCGCRSGTGPDGTPVTRASCLECVVKHVGAAYVLLTEAREGYAHRLRAIGHLHEAEDESQAFPALHATIRDARKTYQTDGTIPDWALLEAPIAEVRSDR